MFFSWERDRQESKKISKQIEIIFWVWIHWVKNDIWYLELKNIKYITADLYKNIMKREEAVLTDQAVKQYMEKNKLRPMFSELTKELLLKKPDDPI